MNDLTIEQDADLLMEFRQTHNDLWVAFCEERGFTGRVLD